MNQTSSSQEKPEWVPADLDLDKPSSARMYDYLLGGHHNFEIDRQLADKAIAAYPETIGAARANRSFLRRAVQFLAHQGIEQFIDIGSGIPTVGHVHEIAQAVNPKARVLYVDIDPVAVAHSETILADIPSTSIVMADARQPKLILEHERTKRLLDFERPMAVLLVAVLHFVVENAMAQEVLATFREAIPPGSYVAIAHPSYDGAPEDLAIRYAEIGKQAALTTKHRKRQEIELLFDGFELEEPGLTHAPLWRPESPMDPMFDQPTRSLSIVGVGRKV
jgi:hypothetical protein